MVGFVLNHRALIDDEWKEVIRYDTRHAQLHVHRFWRPEGQQVTYLEKRRKKDASYELAFEEARTDILDGWQRHRELVEQAGRS